MVVNWCWVSGNDGTDSSGISDGAVGEDERTWHYDWELHFLD